jgi:phage gp45-like
VTELEIRDYVRRLIRQELAPILMGSIQSNETVLRSTVQRFATEGQIQNLRSILPYGLSTKAPAQTPGLVVPIASDPTHLNVVGHFDGSRPDLSDGETILYNSSGQLIYLKEGKIQIGSKASAENLVLGQIFKAFMSQVLELIAQHTHTGNLGYPTSPPTNAADFESKKSSPIDDGAILSDLVFTEKG